MGREAAGWVVTCPAYRLGPFASRATAERQREHVEALGACQERHEVEEVGAGAEPA